MPIVDKESIERYYQALLERDSQYVGIFYVGVKTTGIFCIATCRARKPKRQHVLFYPTAQEAILEGFRPCKVCRPMEQTNPVPEAVQEVLRELERHPDQKLKDYDLKQRGIDPIWLRRWFKQHHQFTFHAYQRMLRINRAYTHIAKGESVTQVAFESGYDSLSGFSDRFQSYLGAAPSQSKDKTLIQLVRFATPLGPMVGCATAEGVCLCEFTDRKMLETELKQLKKALNAAILPGVNPHLELLQTQLTEYFAGRRRAFSVPLHTPGTAFQQTVWQALQQVPYGQTRSYGQQAQFLGMPLAFRAVASANGSNRVAILIPCHRVVGANGNLTGYGGGLARKKWLLDFEQKQAGVSVAGQATLPFGEQPSMQL